MIARLYALNNSSDFPLPNNGKLACFERKWIALLRNISGWCNALTKFHDHSPFNSEEYGCLRFQWYNGCKITRNFNFLLEDTKKCAVCQ